ncbi:unnamed protein product, partial [Ilex paraguariensis]
VQPSAKAAPPKQQAKEVGETTTEIVMITVSNESEGMSPLWLPSPTLPMHPRYPSIIGTPIINIGGPEFGVLYEILG